MRRTDNGKLIAGGTFTSAGGTAANHIARWDGTSWSPLGSGMGGTYPWKVFALTVYNGELIAAGQFSIASETEANAIARWNGTTWSPLGSGMGTGFPSVFALTAYNSELIAGGSFFTAGEHVSAYWARWGCPYARGDLNCDGVINAFDIEPFLGLLFGP